MIANVLGNDAVLRKAQLGTRTIRCVRPQLVVGVLEKGHSFLHTPRGMPVRGMLHVLHASDNTNQLTAKSNTLRECEG